MGLNKDPHSFTKITLDESEMPTQWYNIIPDLPSPPPPPLHPGTHQPVGPADLAPLFPMDLILQEVDYDVETHNLAAATAITPGIESPTISPLQKEGWSAVRAMVKSREVNRIMDDLYKVGARGILVTDIHASRL